MVAHSKCRGPPHNSIRDYFAPQQANLPALDRLLSQIQEQLDSNTSSHSHHHHNADDGTTNFATGASTLPHSATGTYNQASGDTTLPYLSTVTYNCRSLYIGGFGAAATKRSKQLANIKCIAATANIIFLQEVRMSEEDTYALRDAFPNHHIFPNPLHSGKAGTAIMVDQALFKDFHVSSSIVNQGYLQHITLTPTNQNHQGVARYHNVYLVAGDDTDIVCPVKNDTVSSWTARLRQVELMAALPRVDHEVYGGDWNFTLSIEDTPHQHRTAYRAIPDDFMATWNGFISKHGLTEVHQPYHTWYKIGKEDQDLLNSSRLDRIYTSLTQEEQLILTPTARIQHIPHGIHAAYHTHNIEAQYKKHRPQHGRDLRTHISDHMPVKASFQKVSKVSRGYRCPDWVIGHPAFESEVIKRYQHHHDPYVSLLNLDKAIIQASKFIQRNHTSKNSETFDMLTQATNLLRDVKGRADKEHIQAKLQKHPQLRRFLKANQEIDEGKLQDTVRELLEDDLKRKSTEGPARHNRGFTDFIRTASDQLPNGKSRFTEMRATTKKEATKDPKKMARMTKKYWKGVWKKDENRSVFSIRQYLASYNRVLGVNIPKPTKAMLEETIKLPKNSSPGPNGIPFSAYRALLRVSVFSVVDILYGVMEALMEGRHPPPGFNHANLSIFPKKYTGLVSDGRPLSVTNTNNRIIAATIKNAILPFFGDFLLPSQRGFLKGKDIRDNVRIFNELFYTAVKERSPYYLLFLDFKKAFDSLDHTFLLEVLRKIEAPAWLIQVVQNLLRQCRVHVNQFGDFGHFIDIERGVKQGCPLSPILFNIALDVLLFHLSKVSTASSPHTTCAYADDVGVGFSKVDTLGNILPVILRFSEASGLVYNPRKTKLLSSLDCAIDAAVLQGWGPLQVTDHAVYLGVMFGRKVDLYDIYREAWGKFLTRMAYFLHKRAVYSIPRRVIITNVFIFPLFSYLHNFFCFPGDYAKILSDYLEIWLTPFRGAYTPALLSNPKEFFGLHTPLVNFRYRGLAVLASQAEEVQTEIITSDILNESFLISTHIAAASYVIHNELAPTAPKRVFSTRKYYHIMQYSKCERVHAKKLLWNKFSRKGYSRRDWERFHIMEFNYRNIPRKVSGQVRFTQLSILYNSIMTASRVSWAAVVGCESDSDTSNNNEAVELTHDGVDNPDIEVLGSVYAGIRRSARVAQRKAREPQVHAPRKRKRKYASVDTIDTNRHTHHHQKCYFCHSSQDDLDHFLWQCDTVRQAEEHICGKFNLLFPHRDKDRSILLAKFLNDKILALFVLFQFTIVKVRQLLKRGYSSGNPETILAAFTDNCNKLWPGLLSTINNPVRRACVAKSLSDKQKAQSKSVNQLVRKLDTDVCKLYTDGSATTTLDISGAGVYCEWKDSTIWEGYCSLGHFTNNLAEFVAIAIALDFIHSRLDNGFFPYYTHFHIFTDSEVAFNIITGKTLYYNYIELVDYILSSYASLEGFVYINIHWVPGHANIRGNEKADGLAKLGARQDCLPPLSFLEPDINSNFSQLVYVKHQN
mgnify:CR=1 FL=1